MSTPVHVLFLASSRSLHTLRWACDLAAAGYAITLLTADQHDSPEFKKAYERAGVPLKRLPHSSKSGFIRSAGAVYKLVKASETRGRPIRFIHAFYTSDYGLLAVLSGAAPVLLSVMGTDVFSYPDRSRLHRFGTAWILKQAACVAATSRVMARRVQALTAGAVVPFHTPFGVDTEVFTPASSVTKTASQKVMRIISVRHLHYKYGLDILIEAVSMLAEKHPEVHAELHIGGDGPEEKKLTALIEKRQPSPEIKLLGRIAPEKLSALLPEYDVFVAPSREESFGVAILEASACGLPVIGSEVGGIPEVIIHNETGMLFPCEDAKALCRALFTLWQQPELRVRMGQAGRAFVNCKYSRQQALSGMIQVYEKRMMRS